MELNKKYKFVVTTADKTYFYCGKITSKDEKFITIIDERAGKFTLNKDHIVSIQEVY